MKKVFIDPGHGGNDSGAVGVNNLLEKDINLSVALKVEKHLKRCGVEVKLSRTNNISKELKTRTNEANTYKADCLVSIHCNAYDKQAKGVETIAYKNKYNNLAKCVHEEVLKTKAYTVNRGVKEQNLHMLRESNMRSCLIEMAFIDNIEDAKLLREKQDLFAEGIAKGVCRYLGVMWKDNNINGWSQENTLWYYYENGTKKTGWINLNGTWYYLNESGVMKVGWVQVNGKWYFLDTSGAMLTGWQFINNKWYFLKDSGEMIANTTIKIDSSGAMV